MSCETAWPKILPERRRQLSARKLNFERPVSSGQQSRAQNGAATCNNESRDCSGVPSSGLLFPNEKRMTYWPGKCRDGTISCSSLPMQSRFCPTCLISEALAELAHPPPPIRRRNGTTPARGKASWDCFPGTWRGVNESVTKRSWDRTERDFFPSQGALWECRGKMANESHPAIEERIPPRGSCQQ